MGIIRRDQEAVRHPAQIAAVICLQSPSAIRCKISSRKVESAPCLVPLPTSSLSNTAQTLIYSAGVLSVKAFVRAKALCRSSSLGDNTNSPFAPIIFPSCLVYRNRSSPRIVSASTPAVSAASATSVGFLPSGCSVDAVCASYVVWHHIRQMIRPQAKAADPPGDCTPHPCSFPGSYGWPHLGITQRSLSIFTSLPWMLYRSRSSQPVCQRRRVVCPTRWTRSCRHISRCSDADSAPPRSIPASL